MSNPTRTYKKDDLIVEWRQDLCIHCGDCINGLPKVFNLEARPWVNPDGASKEEIRSQVLRCPSGALQLGQP
jgi:uncharacterized Fe-S cluster protein YjdI